MKRFIINMLLCIIWGLFIGTVVTNNDFLMYSLAIVGGMFIGTIRWEDEE
jgi:hypothetical protein